MFINPPAPEPAGNPSYDAFGEHLRRTPHTVPDLYTQLESLLDEVWKREAEQEFQRRIDNAVQAEEERERARRRKAKRETPRSGI